MMKRWLGILAGGWLLGHASFAAQQAARQPDDVTGPGSPFFLVFHAVALDSDLAAIIGTALKGQKQLCAVVGSANGDTKQVALSFQAINSPCPTSGTLDQSTLYVMDMGYSAAGYRDAINLTVAGNLNANLGMAEFSGTYETDVATIDYLCTGPYSKTCNLNLDGAVPVITVIPPPAHTP
jgi:hypothetical protein